MRIALLGTRGIPANYGGFETFAEELATRLAARGHDVAVYCRERHPSPWRGVRLVYLPTIRHKYFDTLFHTFLSTLHLLAHRVDAALYCNGANALFTIAPRVMGIPVALNVDGIERRRKKWNVLARLWFFASERISTLFPNKMVSDARVIERYYLTRYGKPSVFIPYGADMRREESDGALRELGLERSEYFLYVSRFEPENHALQVRCAFEKVATPMKLALVGTAPHAHAYVAEVRATSDPRIVIPGGIYGLGYRELGSHCFAYVHATEVGGTHPALIEAMGRGALVIYRNTPENAEVCADAGLPFKDEETLASRMREALAMPEAERERYRRRAAERVASLYRWDDVTDRYETLLTRLAGKS
jgi:glycosyltransferase involved in cell wall biosynthesis